MSESDGMRYDRLVRIALLVLLAGLAALVIATRNGSSDAQEAGSGAEGTGIAADLSPTDAAAIRRWTGAAFPPVDRCKRQMDRSEGHPSKSACASARRLISDSPVPQLANGERTERLHRVQLYCQRVLVQAGGEGGTRGAFLKNRAYIGICRDMLSRFAQEVGAANPPEGEPIAKADRRAPR